MVRVYDYHLFDYEQNISKNSYTFIVFLTNVTRESVNCIVHYTMNIRHLDIFKIIFMLTLSLLTIKIECNCSELTIFYKLFNCYLYLIKIDLYPQNLKK